MTGVHPRLSWLLAPLALGTARGGMIRFLLLVICANLGVSPFSSGEFKSLFLAVAVAIALCLLLDLSIIERASTGGTGKANETRSRRDPVRMAALATLGLDGSASPDEIRNAFRRVAKASHPDTTTGPGNPRRFREATSAYRVLRRRFPGR